MLIPRLVILTRINCGFNAYFLCTDLMLLPLWNLLSMVYDNWH